MGLVDDVRHFQAQTRLACLPVGLPINPFAVIAAQRAVEAAAKARAAALAKKRTAMPAITVTQADIIAAAEEFSVDWMLHPEAYAAVVIAAVLPPETVKTVMPQPNLSAAAIQSFVPAKTVSISLVLHRGRQRDKFADRWLEAELESEAIGRVSSRAYYLMFGNKREIFEHEKYNCSHSSSWRNHGRKPRDRHPRWLSDTLGNCVFAASRAPVVGGMGYHTSRRLLRLVQAWEMAAATDASVN